MANASDWRIKFSAVTALFSICFLLFGVYSIYEAFSKIKPKIKWFVIICFSYIFIAYGVIHANYVAIATSIKLVAKHHLPVEESILLAKQTNDLLRLLVYPVFGILSIIFIWQVGFGKTKYPKWMVFFYPLLLFLLQGSFNFFLKGQIWIIVMGGYLNLMLIIFFTASTISLWNKK